MPSPTVLTGVLTLILTRSLGAFIARGDDYIAAPDCCHQAILRDGGDFGV